MLASPRRRCEGETVMAETCPLYAIRTFCELGLEKMRTER